MTRCARPLFFLVGVAAVLALGLSVAPGRVGHARDVASSARIAGIDEHAAFVGGADPRTSTRPGSLVGSFGLEALVAVALGCAALLQSSVSAATTDPRRRWRALLVGAPPARVAPRAPLS